MLADYWPTLRLDGQVATIHELRSRFPPAGSWPTPSSPCSPPPTRRYLPTNLTTPEIAREIYVSQNTVKTHVQNLSH